ncbi:MAG: type VI secretion system-associated protein TagF [Thalassolituus sp.]
MVPAQLIRGLFGKVPAHGDFITRQLPGDFLNVWDEWLQCVVAGSKEHLGDSWLDIYLTSPIWRFVLRPGVVDANAWAGVLVPSVDSVGRYFPLTLTVQLPSHTDVFSFLAECSDWFAQLETIALAALHEQQNADQLMAALETLPLAAVSTQLQLGISGAQVCFGNKKSLFSSMLNQTHRDSMPFSLWCASENENMPATSLFASGLPSPQEYVSMLSGNWS